MNTASNTTVEAVQIGTASRGELMLPLEVSETQRHGKQAGESAKTEDAQLAQQPTLPELPRYQKVILWTGIALTAYANGLDNFTMSVYLQEAASEFNGIVQYTTLAVIQSMILGVGKPVFAKLADTFGRAFTYAISILFFTVGTIVISSSRSIQGLGAGMVFFSIGNTGITFSQSVTIADLVGVRWRTTIGNVFAIHFVINFGIASKITAALIPDRWRWGVGVFTIINPFVTAPIITVLGLQQCRAYKAGQLAPYPYRGMGFWTALRALASDLDLIGLFTMAGGFLLILLPLTIAGAAPHGYQTGYIIAMFVLGAALLALWPLVELKVAKTPLVNMRKIARNPNVLVPAAIIFCDQFSYAMTYTPAFQWCRIMFGWGVADATYFYYTQSLCLVVFGIAGGVAATVTRRYKWVTFAGACVRLLGLGLMVRYRDAGSSTIQAVMPQVIQGLGGGLMTANILVAAQATVPHSEMAIVTGFYLLTLQLGSAIGAAVVGAIQKQLRVELHEFLDPLVNSTVVEKIYAQGSNALAAYPIGTPVRAGVIKAWSLNMHQIITGAITIAAVDVILCALLPDKELSDNQSLVDDEPVSTFAPTALRPMRKVHEAPA